MPVGEAFAARTFQCLCGALCVRHGAGRITEVELGQIAVRVGDRPVMVSANHAALENGKEVLRIVAVVVAATAELAVAVKRRPVAGELAADGIVKASVVRSQMR